MIYTTLYAALYHFHNSMTVYSYHCRYHLYRYFIEDIVVIAAAAVEFANLSLSSMSHNHRCWCYYGFHCSEVIMGAMASQITSLTIVYSTVCSGSDQRKHQSSASLACVRGIHRSPVNSPHKWPVTRKMFPFNDVSWRQWFTFGVVRYHEIFTLFFKINSLANGHCMVVPVPMQWSNLEEYR